MNIGVVLLVILTAQTKPPQGERPARDAPRIESPLQPEARPRKGPTRDYIGRVREVSGGPAGRSQAILLTDAGRQLSLHPVRQAEASELVRLSGLRVRIRATPGPGLPGPDHVRVLRYEILDIGGGITPRVGHIARLEQNGEPRLLFVDQTGRADLLPTGWTHKLRHHVGSKVWMSGKTQHGVFSPSRFAILRPVRKGELK